MDRRGFFKLLGMGVAGIALEEAIPFNRVWSFPTQVVIPHHRLLTSHEIAFESLRMLENNLTFIDYDKAYRLRAKIGTVIKIRKPPRYGDSGYESPYL